MRTPLALITLVSFIITSLTGPMPQARADDFRLPLPGIMVHLSPGFNPPILKGIRVHPDDPFRFDFILDTGDNPLSDDAIKGESAKLIKYFLASLTIPEKDLWVNLSPYEKDRIIPQSFGLTEMGRDLLAEDYLLKQITASLIYPEDAIGKKFWKRIYEEALKQYGTTNIPVNTFNKVWIVPEKAVVYENTKAGTAYVVESKLKVMLEQDYLSMTKHAAGETRGQDPNINRLGSQIVREIVIPQLTKEVNENRNFSHLRQVYNSLILAAWYKNKIKDSILGHVYDDKKKVAGVGYNDLPPAAIYQRYLQAFKKGVYHYIKEEQDPLTQAMIPKKYFSGGVNMFLLDEKIDYAQASQVPVSLDRSQIVTVDLAESPKDRENDNAQLASGITRRDFLRTAGMGIAALGMPGVARSAVGPLPNIFTARKILMDHLNKLAYTKQISKAAVYSTDYWLNDVFNSDQKMYLYALDDIETAVDAGIKANDKGKNFDAKRFSALAQQALNEQKPDAKLKRFFTGSWSRYMSSLYNSDNYALLEKDIIRQRARAVDPALGDMVDQLVRNANKWDRNDIDAQWQKFNDTYLIPRNYYASVSPQYNGRNWYYFALIYHLEPITRVTLLNGKTIDVLTGRRVDNDDFFAGDLGNAPKGFSRVFIDLNAIDGSTKLYLGMTLRKILPRTSIGFKDLGGFVNLLNNFKAQGVVNLKTIIVDSTKKHEEAHKVYEDFKGIKLDKGFGMFQKSFDDLRNGSSVGVDVSQSEVYAYLSQIWDGKLPGAVILNLFEFFMRGTSTTQFYAACFILDQMTQSDLDYNDPDGVIAPVNKLLQMPDNVLSEKAGAILKEFFPPLKDQAMAHDQNTGGIDLTPAVMDLHTQNAGEAIKFHLDPAILQQLQNAPGFVPVIINIQPMNDLHRFLGINDAMPQ